MTGKELKKLNRADLLELLLAERRENERLRAQLQKVTDQLNDRSIRIETAGSLVEAASHLNELFAAAQAEANRILDPTRPRGEGESL